MEETQKFYKSKKWEAFRRVIIEEHTDADGYVHCAICGEPILKKYDLIVHHKRELSEANVNDATVSLNPDNVECVHFKCHNKIHDRWQGGNSGWKPVKKKVYIVYGSPCSGKTTWVHENASENDLIVDLDSIWQMISINDRYHKPGAIKSVVFELRDKLYDIIKYRSGKWSNAFVITGGALKGDRGRLMKRIGADELIYIEATMKECVDRVHARHGFSESANEWVRYVQDWFESFQPEEKEILDTPGSE